MTDPIPNPTGVSARTKADATLDSAQDIGQGAEYGSIDVGKRADLILFDGNPLETFRPLCA